jgi:hypothetical protein
MTGEIRITHVADSRALIPQVLPKMQSLSGAMGRRAQRLVPKRTWALHDSIENETTVEGSRIVARVTVGTGYWSYVERGTSRMAAQPYMRPAFLQTSAADFTGGGSGTSAHGIVRDTTERGDNARGYRGA